MPIRSDALVCVRGDLDRRRVEWSEWPVRTARMKWRSVATVKAAVSLLGVLAFCVVAACQPIERGAGSVEDEGPITAESLGFSDLGPAVAGEVAGQPFELYQAELSSISLVLQQGSGPLGELQVTIFLGLRDREVPQERSWKILGEDDDNPDPWILVSYRDLGSGRLSTLRFDRGFDLELQFGRARGLFLPGEIDLTIPGSAPTRLRGAFVAEVDGMVITRPSAGS
ncbi:MAG: hypothetical protein MPN21_07040 [Thermoanaerobaculia bacterium]|nr:hypothetical protein [Thermoanaerobaculia bacterium]